jgi:hypothetical protein
VRSHQVHPQILRRRLFAGSEIGKMNDGMNAEIRPSDSKSDGLEEDIFAEMEAI